MKFRQIPQVTPKGIYRIDVSWDYVEHQLEHFNENGTLQLDPKFQRAHVWTEKQQIAYVEFILRGGFSGREIFFSSPLWMRGGPLNAPIYLVDGKQRLEAVRRFMRNELRVLPLPYSKPEGYLLSDFEDSPDVVVASFSFYVNALPTYADVLKWYLDLNAGGVVHTREELKIVKDMLEQEKRRIENGEVYER